MPAAEAENVRPAPVPLRVAFAVGLTDQLYDEMVPVEARPSRVTAWPIWTLLVSPVMVATTCAEGSSAPVITTSNQPSVLAVNAQLPVKNLAELVAYAKANPGKLNYASVGNGSSSHLTMELLKSAAGFDAVHVPFNGSPPAVTATIQGETQMLFAVMQPFEPQSEAASFARSRSRPRSAFRCCPTFPLIAESGIELAVRRGTGIVVPAGTPQTDHRS